VSLQEGHIPSYSFPEAAAHTLARAVAYGAWRNTPPGKIPNVAGVDQERGRQAIARDLASSKGESRWMESALMNELFTAYGIRTSATRPAKSRGEAASVAKSVGFPVALKVRSPEVLHKTDVGGVRLNLRSEAEVAQAFDGIREALSRSKPEARFDGVTVEPMVQGGVETIVGMTRDPSFGPVVLFGLGGVAVELLRDVSLRVAPLTDNDAEEMVREIGGYPLLNGYRGAPVSNVASVVDLLHRVSRLASDHPEIMELDLNPVVVFHGDAPCIAIDARLRLAPAGAS